MKVSKFVASLLFLFGIFIFPHFAFAAAPFSEDFTSYSNGSNLNGQGGWTASGITVQSAGCETTRCVGNFGYGTSANRTGTASYQGSWDFRIYVSAVSPYTYYQTFFFFTNSGDGEGGDLMDIYRGTGGTVSILDNRSNVLWDNVSLNAWHTFTFSWNISGGQCHFYVDVDHSGTPVESHLYGSATNCYGNNLLVTDGGIDTVNIASSFYNGSFLIGSIEPSVLAPTDTSTHIISTIPTNAATVSTTTSVGSEVYVNSADWVSGMVLHVDMYNQTVAAVSANAIDACNVFGLAKCSMDFPINSAGDTGFSTSTTFNYGGTIHAKWSIQVPTFWSSLPIIGGLFEPSVLYSTSTTFIIGQSTGLDTAITQGGAAITNYLLTGTTTTDVVNCNALGFSLTSCLVSLIIPNSASIGTFLNGFQGSFLQKVPFGYVTRFMAILTSTATTSLPSLVITVPPGLPVAGQSVDLTPWNDLFTGNSVLNTATSSSDGKTLRQAVEPDWDFFVLFCFGIAVIFELLGVAGRTNTGAGNHGGKRTEYISTEWVNRNTRH